MICGIIARTGSSTSPSRRFTRAAVSFSVVIVVLKFSTARISSSDPRRSWSNERITAAIGPAASVIRSASGSLRWVLDSSTMPARYSATGIGSGVGVAAAPASDASYASSGSHEHTRLRSPAAPSIRDTGGKYLSARSRASG